MPNLDGTGPRGEGPLTGYGRGYCIVRLTTREQELDFLGNQVKLLQSRLIRIGTRIEAIHAAREVRHAGI